MRFSNKSFSANRPRSTATAAHILAIGGIVGAFLVASVGKLYAEECVINGLVKSVLKARPESSDHFIDAWGFAASAEKYSQKALSEQAARRQDEIERHQAQIDEDANFASRLKPELTEIPQKDYIATPVAYSTRVGAEPLASLRAIVVDPSGALENEKSLRQLATWARANPDLAEHIGVFADEKNGKLSAALPLSMKAIIDYRISTRDKLAPSMGVVEHPTTGASRSWHDQLSALARRTIPIFTESASIEELAAAQLRIAGAAMMPERMAAAIQKRAAKLERQLRSTKKAWARVELNDEARSFTRSVDSLITALTEVSGEFLEIPGTEREFAAAREKFTVALSKRLNTGEWSPAEISGLAADVLKRKIEARNMVAKRKQWKHERGWDFAHEVGLREFFRLHAREVRETLATREAWLSPRRRRIIRLLGFEYENGTLKIPSYKEFTQNYDRLATLLKIPVSDRIRFVRNFEKPDGTIIAIPEGEPIPADYRPLTRPLTTREILEQIARREFPLAENEFLDQTGDVFYIHDAISHGAAFLDNPAYARAFVDSAEALVRREGSLDGLGRSVNRNGSLSNRGFYALEELVILRKDVSGPKLDTTLALPDGVLAAAGGYEKLRYQDVATALRKLPDAEIESRMNTVLNGLEKKILSLGGNASDDFFLRRDKFHDLEKPIVNKMYFSKAWRLLIREAANAKGSSREKRIEALARVQTYLARLSQLDPTELVLHAMRPKQDESSVFWQLMRGSGILDPSKPDELKLLESIGLVDDLHQDAVRKKTEVKYAIKDLSKIPESIRAALTTGEDHPTIKRRGIVTMEYLPVTPENLDAVFELLNASGIPFGTPAEQQAFKATGRAAEIRLMRKRIKVREPESSLDRVAFRDIYQITIGDSEGIEVSKLETPEALSLSQAQKMREIIGFLRPKARHRLEKAFFEHVLIDESGATVLRPDSTPMTVEVDLIYGKSKDGAPRLQFPKAEIKFTASSGVDAKTQVEGWQARSGAKPTYFGPEKTHNPRFKSRAIAEKGAPKLVVADAALRAKNEQIMRGIASEFAGWADAQQVSAGHVEIFETEAKFSLPQLSKLPGPVLRALTTGTHHPDILRRGYVVQEYLPVTPENLRSIYRELKEAGINFGTQSQQEAFFGADGSVNAKEIRMMSKSIKIGTQKVEIFQATVKGKGGLSVDQLETQEDLSPEQVEKLKAIFTKYRPKVESRVKKAYFEPVATYPDGRRILRADGTPYTVEVDIFLGREGKKFRPEFINGEIEFHGKTKEDSIADATRWRQDPAQRPEYLRRDLTEADGVKSRDIAAKGAPDHIKRELRPARNVNGDLLDRIMADFDSWADDAVKKAIYSEP